MTSLVHHTEQTEQELSYRKQIARQLRTQFVEGISVTLKSTLRVTQGHWKRNHWADHTRLTVRQVTIRYGTVYLTDVEYYRDLEMWVRGHSRSFKVAHLKVWVRFPNFFYSNPNSNPNPRIRGQGH